MQILLDKALQFVDFFLPKEYRESIDYSEKQRSRVLIIGSLFGIFVPYILVNSSEQYPKEYFGIFYFLTFIALFCIIGFKLFKLKLALIGRISTLTLTLVLSSFMYRQEIVFSGTTNWFSTAIIMSIFVVDLKWGFFNFILLLSSIIIAHYFYASKGLMLPEYWKYPSWVKNVQSDQILALIFNTVITSIFLYTKKKADQELISSHETIRFQQETLFKKSRMAELGEVSGGIAHEINNPMTIIRANAQKIKRSIIDNQFTEDEIISRIEKIEITCSRITKVIDGLRNYSRDAASDPIELMDLEKLFFDIKEIFKEKMHHKEINFNIESNQLSPFAYGRYGQTFQVLVNLINNACDAIDKLDNKSISLICQVKEKETLIEVIDSGKGIPPEMEEKVFQPFFTTKPLGKGTGLGLSISYSLMEAQKGKLYFDRSHKDSRFVLALPNSL
jgi:signal transduction histidine kinase